VRERRLRILILLTLVFGFELSAAALTSPLLGIDRVAIRGAEGLPAQEAAVTRRMAALPAGTNLLRAPLGQMESKMKALPWVRTARVTWMTPHALSIRFAPREPVVVASIGGQRYEVDEAGVPIRIARPATENRMPHIEVEKAITVRAGTPMNDPALLAAIKLYHDAPSQPMVHIAKIRVDPAGNMCLNMIDGIQVRLGQPEDLAGKMQYLQRVYTLEPNVCSRMLAINLSVPKQPACTLKTDIQASAAGAPDKTSPSDARLPGGDVAL
jgi:cell division protein FtsQ